VAVAASIYLVLVLEILKLKRWRQFQLKREKLAQGAPPPVDTEVDAQLARELETGEFDASDVRAAVYESMPENESPRDSLPEHERRQP
jgi:hypothetical protein